MQKWQRRVRGAIGMGLTWAMAWFGAGVLLLLIIGPDAADVPFPIGFGMFGFLAGVTFSAVLAIVEGRRSFDQMSLPRFAGWGGVGGLLMSGIFVLAAALSGDTTPLEHLVLLGPVFAVAGAGSAAGSLGLARMAEEREPLDASADASEVEPAGGEPQAPLEGATESLRSPWEGMVPSDDSEGDIVDARNARPDRGLARRRGSAGGAGGRTDR